jgi:hypothetical protein
MLDDRADISLQVLFVSLFYTINYKRYKVLNKNMHL